MARNRTRRTLPAASALLVGSAFGAYLAFAPITSLPTGDPASAIESGNAVLLIIAGLVVGCSTCAFVGALLEQSRLAWGGVTGLGLLGLVPFALVPQVWIVAALAAAGLLLAPTEPEALTRTHVGVAVVVAAATVPLFALTFLTAPAFRTVVAALAVVSLGAVAANVIPFAMRLRE